MHSTLITLLEHWLVSGLALALTAALVPGFRIRGFFTTLMAVFLIGAANSFVWPVLFILTLPLTIITFGLFVFILNAIILRLCAAFLKDFEISGWLSAIAGAMILAIMSSFLHWMLI